MNRRPGFLLGLFIAAMVAGPHAAEAVQVVDPAQIALDDSYIFYPTDIMSNAALPGLLAEHSILADNTTGWLQIPVTRQYPRAFLALESDVVDIAHSPLYPDFPKYNLNPAAVSIWNGFIEMGIVTSLLQRAVMAPPGSIRPIAQLPVAGRVLSMTMSKNPALTTALSGTPSVCWEQPTGLYAAYANGLDYLTPSWGTSEGPRLMPDGHVWPLPGDLCR